jgi:hypothetical protein
MGARVQRRSIDPGASQRGSPRQKPVCPTARVSGNHPPSSSSRQIQAPTWDSGSTSVADRPRTRRRRHRRNDTSEGCTHQVGRRARRQQPNVCAPSQPSPQDVALCMSVVHVLNLGNRDLIDDRSIVAWRVSCSACAAGQSLCDSETCEFPLSLQYYLTAALGDWPCQEVLKQETQSNSLSKRRIRPSRARQ